MTGDGIARAAAGSAGTSGSAGSSIAAKGPGVRQPERARASESGHLFVRCLLRQRGAAVWPDR
ncbi:hypothetical protein ACFQ9Z_01875 [Streptomyces sp. NPDC056580]|uniref:hypothetical protein n=1 Tax=Streptomyces sp. NPDC056580 TaxID=3345872 RepID=UPI0036C80503